MGKKSLLLRLGRLALAWLCLTSVARANQPFDLDTLLDKIQHTYERTSALTARFDQTATLTSINRQQTSAGQLYIEKPHSIRWEYTAAGCPNDPLRWDDATHPHAQAASATAEHD